MKNIPPRPPAEVMRLPVLGAFYQTRLSFMRVLLRRIKNENWKFERPLWEINKNGEGVAVYRATLSPSSAPSNPPKREYSLVVFSHDLPPHRRSDRVIADAWDATFTLFDGRPTRRDIARMQKQVPLQEAGRNNARQIVLSRANRSARVFDSAVDSLARGRQPKEAAEAGYLMRTTAVYGNGKFGIADRAQIAGRPEFAAPFAAELLAVFMFRAFPADLVEHLAAARSKNAAPFCKTLRRTLGIGNSTGLGMAPFLINHPILLHRWIFAREKALARVRSLSAAAPAARNLFLDLLPRAESHVVSWQTACGGRQKNIAALQSGIGKLRRHCGNKIFAQTRPWNALYEWGARALPAEAREMFVSLLLEPHGNLIDGLAAEMAGDESFTVDGEISTGEMRALLLRHCAWITRADFSRPAEHARFWYVSEEKQEPRLGQRGADSEKWELPLAIMRDARRMLDDLRAENTDLPLALFLLRRPQHRNAARRAQIAARFPYCEIQDNLIAANMLPLDLLRCKLSFFGATRFDPRSDRWLRINMFQHAPYPGELCNLPADEWAWDAPA